MNLSPPDQPAEAPYLVAALYKFARLDGLEDMRAAMLARCRDSGIRGTLLLAPEGINGTVAGSDAAIAALIEAIEALPGLSGLELKYSRAYAAPFLRMKVRLKREIVTMGVKDCDPAAHAGAYVEPADWNALICDPDTVVIDTRNGYETALGSFAGALDPGTASFSEFPEWSERHLGDLKGRKVAMFCTGGIRCEKATAHLRALGLDEVFHLKGGILRYLEEVPAEDSLWQGECFVFDERVAVRHGLRQGEATLCRACRHPLTATDRDSPLFEEGVSCPHCQGRRSEEDRERYRERQRQVELAARRGGPAHVGGSHRE